MRNKVYFILVIVAVCIVVLFCMKENITIFSSADAVSNKKIAWGIKRNDNHEQPDLGTKNKELVDKYERNSNWKF